MQEIQQRQSRRQRGLARDEKAKTDDPVTTLSAARLRIVRRFRENRRIRRGAAPVEPLNGLIGRCFGEVSWIIWQYEEDSVSHTWK